MQKCSHAWRSKGALFVGRKQRDNTQSMAEGQIHMALGLNDRLAALASRIAIEQQRGAVLGRTLVDNIYEAEAAGLGRTPPPATTPRRACSLNFGRRCRVSRTWMRFARWARRGTSCA